MQQQVNESTPILNLRPLRSRIRQFAVSAVKVEREIGTPAEIQMAVWAIKTAWGRDIRAWQAGRPFDERVLEEARVLRAGTTIGPFMTMAADLETWFTGLTELCGRANLRMACHEARLQ